MAIGCFNDLVVLIFGTLSCVGFKLLGKTMVAGNIEFIQHVLAFGPRGASGLREHARTRKSGMQRWGRGSLIG